MKHYKAKALVVLVLSLVMVFAMSAAAHGATVHKYSPYRTGKVVEGPLNVRSSANTSSSDNILGSLSQGRVISLTGYVKKNDRTWYRMTYAGKTAYVAASCVKRIDRTPYVLYTPIKYGKITADPYLYIRVKPSTSAKSVGSFAKGRKIKIRGYRYVDGQLWYWIKWKGNYRYISGDYVKRISYSAYKKKSSSGGTSSAAYTNGQAVANYAVQFIGVPYVYGGASLSSGVDCSGFVMCIYAHFGVSLPHSSYSQMGCGTGVSASSLQPGDLVFYNGGGHVGIYIGGGQIVHASSSGSVKISSVYYNTIVCVRRIL